MRLFDSHAHLDMRMDELGGAEAVLERAFSDGVEGVVAIAGATQVGSYAATFELCDKVDSLWCAAGIHPHAASNASLAAVDVLRSALEHPRVVALGETGLDFHYNYSSPKEQRQAFVSQIEIAHAHQLPLVVHTRNADAETITILDGEGASELGGVIHCFSSGAELALRAVDLGFYVSFSGIVTFPKADEIREVARLLPEERILAETDAPFLAPVPHRGKVNEPMRVRHVVERLAEVREAELEVFANIVVENTYRCFGIEQAGR